MTFSTSPNVNTYVIDNVDSKLGHVFNQLYLLLRDLGMLDKFVDVLLADSLLGQDVEEDDSDLVVDGDVGGKKNWDNVPHLILDLLAVSVCPHGEVLLHLAQFVDVALKLNMN